MFIFAIPMWFRIIFFIIGNGPTIWKIFRELRGLVSEMSDKEQAEVMSMSKEDLKRYKVDQDKEALFRAIKKKKAQVVAKRAERAIAKEDKKSAKQRRRDARLER